MTCGFIVTLSVSLRRIKSEMNEEATEWMTALQWTLADVSRGGGGERAPLMMTVGAKGTGGRVVRRRAVEDGECVYKP